MGQIIAFLMENFTLTFLVLGVIAAAISVSRHGKSHWPEAMLAFFCLFEIGFTFLYNAVFHIAFGDLAASYIGWAPSPFQAEVGWASVGYAALGILAYKRGFDMRLAAILGSSCFLLGAAAGHVYQMVTAHNFAPGNAGIVFWTDIFVPIIGFVLLWWRYGRHGGDAATAAPPTVH